MHTLSLLAALSLCAGERFPLGPLGASAEVSPGSAAAAVVSVAADGPAAAADLRVGDLIVAAEGSAFEAHTNQVDDGGRGPQRALGEAVDAVLSGAWASAEDAGGGTLALAVEREGARVELELVLPRRPPLSGPDAAAGRAALRSAAAEQLLQSQRPNGSWDSPVGLSGDRVLSAWALVALLGHGAPEQRDAVDRAAQWLRGPEGRAWIPDDYLSKGPDNLGNWALTSTAVALSEHHLATCEQADRPVIARCLAALDARMDAEGRFGHDVSVGYGGKGFNVINTLYHLAVAMGAAAGLELDESAWELSMAQLRASISANGGVRYWTMAGTGTGDATLRTGSLALGLLLSGREPALATRLVAYLDWAEAVVRGIAQPHPALVAAFNDALTAGRSTLTGGDER